MRFFGYDVNDDSERPVEVNYLTITANSTQLRELAQRILKAADTLDKEDSISRYVEVSMPPDEYSQQASSLTLHDPETFTYHIADEKFALNVEATIEAHCTKIAASVAYWLLQSGEDHYEFLLQADHWHYDQW